MRRVLIEGHPSVDIHELVGGDHVKVDKTKRYHIPSGQHDAEQIEDPYDSAVTKLEKRIVSMAKPEHESM